MFAGAQIAALVRSNRVSLRSLATSGTCYHFSNVTYRKNRTVWHVVVKTRRNYFVFRRCKLCRSLFLVFLLSVFRAMTCRYAVRSDTEPVDVWHLAMAAAYCTMGILKPHRCQTVPWLNTVTRCRGSGSMPL